MREDDCIDIFVDNFLFMAEQLRDVSADIKWTGKTKQQLDGPGRIRARDHLLPRLLQNAPGALGGVVQ